MDPFTLILDIQCLMLEMEEYDLVCIVISFLPTSILLKHVFFLRVSCNHLTSSTPSSGICVYEAVSLPVHPRRHPPLRHRPRLQPVRSSARLLRLLYGCLLCHSYCWYVVQSITSKLKKILFPIFCVLINILECHTVIVLQYS